MQDLPSERKGTSEDKLPPRQSLPQLRRQPVVYQKQQVMVKGKVTEGKQAEEALFKFYTTELATMALNFLTGANDVNVEEQVGERRSATFSAQTHYRGLVKHSQYPDMDKVCIVLFIFLFYLWLRFINVLLSY